jgi:hypothetical protein
MRFMIIGKGDKRTEAGVLPNEDELAPFPEGEAELRQLDVEEPFWPEVTLCGVR